MLIEVEGIIINETPSGETSKIINLLTKDKGVIGIMCKGAKTMKSKHRALTMPLTQVKLLIYYKENKMSLLSESELINNFNNIKQDIMLIAYANYILDLTYQVIRQESASNIYDTLIQILNKLDDKLDPLILTNIIELKYLNFLGIGLNLDECIKCGNKTSIVTIDGDAGGYICKNCYINEKIVSPKTIKLLRLYNCIDVKSISKIDINDNEKYEVNYFLNRYYDRYTGLYLKSKKFLDDLNKLG